MSSLHAPNQLERQGASDVASTARFSRQAFLQELPASSEDVVRWQPLACLDFSCEVHSPVPSVLNRARQLFRARDKSTPAPCSGAVFRWRVTPLESSGSEHGCQVRDLDSDELYDLSDEQSALTFIEYSIVQRLVEYVKSEHHQSGAPPSAASGLIALHGALLCKGDNAIIIAGPSEAGKSTLSCALWQSGWSLLSDDYSFLRGENLAYPAARRVSLRRGSRELVGEEVWERIQSAPSSTSSAEGWLFHPHEVDGRNESRPAPVRVVAFILLERRNREMAPAQAEIHQPAQAAFALLPYCSLLSRPTSEANDANKLVDWGAALSRIAPVVSRVPVYTLGRGPLPAMVKTIETLREEL